MRDFTIGTGEDGRALVLEITRESRSTEAVDVASIEFRAWARTSTGAPTGAMIYQATGTETAEDGQAVWDSTNQLASWILPAGGIAAAAQLVGVFVATKSDGRDIFLPSPNDGQTVYIPINVVQVGPTP